MKPGSTSHQSFVLSVVQRCSIIRSLLIMKNEIQKYLPPDEILAHLAEKAVCTGTGGEIDGIL